eukprot:TRINITY_DN3091_c0_g3_i2.p2 TRINITY_DN3091_c0_g3~~TRINITY_DN3091_c0_g3_i2.p2  ORF type:complete len:147 (-),score=19.46 TRINITY_DN3091_c0_g3_i2:1422-1862(-)
MALRSQVFRWTQFQQAKSTLCSARPSESWTLCRRYSATASDAVPNGLLDMRNLDELVQRHRESMRVPIVGVKWAPQRFTLGVGGFLLFAILMEDPDSDETADEPRMTPSPYVPFEQRVLNRAAVAASAFAAAQGGNATPATIYYQA